MRRRSIFMLAGAGLLVAVVTAVVLFQDPDRYRDEVATLLGEAAGYPVTLRGPLSLSWRPSPTLSASRVGVAIPSARVELEAVRIHLEIGSLLARRFRAREVRIDGVSIDLDSTESTEEAAVLPDPGNIPVDELVVTGIVVRRAGESVFAIDRASLTEPDSSRGAKVDVAIPVPGGEIGGRLRLKVVSNRVKLDELALDTPLGQIEGRLSVAMDAARLRVGGELLADAIAFPGSADGGGRVFARHSVDLSGLRFLDASMRVRVGRLSIANIRLNDVTIPIRVADGLLDSNASAIFAGGSLGATLGIVASKNDWSLVVDLEQANAGDALGMLGMTSAEKGGRLGLQANLRASGPDTDQLLSSLSGDLRADASQMHLIASAAAIAGSDVLASLGRSLSGGDNRRISVDCAVARFTLRDGIASSNDGIGVQTRTTNVLGGGQVSFPKERVDLVLRPWPREGLGLSATAIVGSVGVTGPLSDPRVGLTSDAALRGGATAGAAFLTGGLSLIAQGLLERARGDVPCQQAAGGKPPARAASRHSGVTSTIDKASDGTSKAAREVSGAVKGIGKTLKGLFGGSGGGSGAASGGSEQ